MDSERIAFGLGAHRKVIATSAISGATRVLIVGGLLKAACRLQAKPGRISYTDQEEKEERMRKEVEKEKEMAKAKAREARKEKQVKEKANEKDNGKVRA